MRLNNLNPLALGVSLLTASLSQGTAEVLTPTRALNANAFTDNVSETSLAMEASDDTIIASWWSTAIGIQFARSADGGLTWTAPANIEGAHNQYILKASGNGLWSIFDQYNLTVSRSTNDGLSWNNAVEMTSPSGINWGFFSLIASNNNGMLLLSSFELNTTQAQVMKSLDGGLTWTEEGVIPASYVTNLVHVSGSTWMATLTGTGEVVVSPDNGATWSSAGAPDSFVPLGTPVIESDHAGTLVAAGNYRISISSNGGLLWSPAQIVNQNFASFSGDPSGPISSSDRSFICYVGSDEWKFFSHTTIYQSVYFYADSALSAATSYNGGETWTASEELVPDVGNWYGNASYAEGLTNVIAAAQGNTVLAWDASNLTVQGQPTGTDGDVVYRVLTKNPPVAAARDWELFE